MEFSCSTQYWLIILFVLISESSSIFFSIIDYFQIEYFRKFLISEKKEFPNKDDMKKCLKNNIDSYKKIILPSFFIGIFICNTLNIRPFKCDDYNINRSIPKTIIHMLFSDYLFYILHRIMHLSYFYKKYHKQHHEYKITFALVNHYIDLNELIAFLFPIVLPAVLLNVHVYDLYFVSFIFNFAQGYAHSGYNFKFLNKIFDSNHHDLHHTHFNCNYAALTKIPDLTFNTYKKI
tara:strand:- start:1594 stop:2295 length:702 start_codon:yes stop_codon:yes gene_type:complete